MTRRVHVSHSGKIQFGGETAGCRWSREAKQDVARELLRYHGLDLATNIAESLVAELNIQFTLTPQEKVLALKDLLEVLRS